MTEDRQRQRVYDAEQRVCDQLDFAARGARSVTVHGSTVTVTGDTRFGSLAHAQQWLDQLRARRWFVARWPVAAASPLVARARRGRMRAHYEHHGSHGVVAVPVPGNTTGWAMRELVLIHEAAHHVVACQLDPLASDGGAPTPPTEAAHDLAAAAHGAAFTAVMLELCGHELGAETRLLLSAAYQSGGVAVAAWPPGSRAPGPDWPAAGHDGAGGGPDADPHAGATP